MKKIVSIILCILCFVMLQGCGNNGTQEDGDKLMTVQQILDSAKPSDLVCDKYSLKKYTQPLWNNQIVYNETVMFIRDSDGNIPEKKLAYPIAKILEVRDSALTILYEQDVDYQVTQDGNLKALPGGGIYVTDFDDYYLPQDKPGGIGALSKSVQGRFLDYGESDYFYSRQVCVTYITVTKYSGAKPAFNKDALPKTLQKLSARENLKIVFYGDSITEGCNASGHYNVAPNMPRFSEMTAARLKNHYGYDDTDITVVNTAVGGWLSDNGKGELTSRVLDHQPDIVVLGFGMNDGTFGIPDDVFGNNIDFMVRKIKNTLSDCEIILISTMLPNPDATTQSNGDYLKKQKDYQSVLYEIAAGYDGVAVADVTAVHEHLLSRKDYCDMTGNNINHPNDFLIRIYTQVILSNLIENI
jgi:lysophospholipase L1-like esterase